MPLETVDWRDSVYINLFSLWIECTIPIKTYCSLNIGECHGDLQWKSCYHSVMQR